MVQAKETRYYVGRSLLQVSNHCLLTFAEYDGPESIQNTYLYNVYLALPWFFNNSYYKRYTLYSSKYVRKRDKIVQLNGILTTSSTEGKNLAYKWETSYVCNRYRILFWSIK